MFHLILGSILISLVATGVRYQSPIFTSGELAQNVPGLGKRLWWTDWVLEALILAIGIALAFLGADFLTEAFTQFFL